MTAPTVPVTIHLSDGNGVDYAGVAVIARLDRSDSHGGDIIPRNVGGTTDANGLVVLNLFPNDPIAGLGTTGSRWMVKARPSGSRPWQVTVQVPNSACNLSDLTDLSLIPSAVPLAATVRSTVLTGLSVASAADVTSADTILSAAGKLQAKHTALSASSGAGIVGTTLPTSSSGIVLPPSTLDFYVKSSPIDVRVALPGGYVTDGSVDYTTYVQKVMDYVRDYGGGRVILPADLLVMISYLSVYSGTEIVAPAWSAGFVVKAGGMGLCVNNGTGGTSDPDQNQRNIRFSGFQVRGENAVPVFNEQRHLLNLNAISDFLAEDLQIKGFQGDGIYFGSSNSAGVERHNRDLRVTRCTFDGVNKQNRNGVSIIDGERVDLYRNRFVNCSRSDMPGPIDIEPDANAFAVIKHITVEKNHIQDCGGQSGAISAYLPLAYGVGAMTTPPEDFRFLENTILNVTSPAILVRFRNVSTPVWLTEAHGLHNVKISRNNANTGQIAVEGVRGVSVDDNDTTGSAQIFLGSISSTTVGNVIDVQAFNNRCREVTGIYGGICIGNGSNVQVYTNDFYKVSQALALRAICLLGEGATTVSDNVKIFDNHFVGTYTNHVYMASHTPTAASTYIYSNTKEGGGDITVSAALPYKSPNATPRGTFTPVLYDTGAGMTITQTSVGEYVRSGDLVFCNLLVTVSAISGTGTALRISGLPFAASVSLTAARVPVSVSSVAIPVTHNKVAGIIAAGATEINLRQQGSNVSDDALSYTAVTASSVFSATFFYRV